MKQQDIPKKIGWPLMSGIAIPTDQMIFYDLGDNL